MLRMAGMQNSAVYRLQKDFKQLMDDPVPGLVATPNPENILEWFFVISGPADTPFEGGFYMGSLKFPTEYPFKAPRLMFHTPNGRFAVETRICLSVTDYHQEQWNPTWNVGAILNATISFMTGNEPTFGAVRASADERKAFAAQSLAWCLNSEDFKKHFTTLAENIEKELRDDNKYDAAMAEYITLKEERAKNPKAYMSDAVFGMGIGMEYQVLRLRGMMDAAGNPPAVPNVREGEGDGPAEALEAWLRQQVDPPGQPLLPGLPDVVAANVEQELNVMRNLRRRNPEQARMVDAVAARRVMLHARRAQAAQARVERFPENGARLAQVREAFLKARIPPHQRTEINGVNSPAAGSVALRTAGIVRSPIANNPLLIPVEVDARMNEDERAQAVLATHMEEIEKMNREALNRMRARNAGTVSTENAQEINTEFSGLSSAGSSTSSGTGGSDVEKDATSGKRFVVDFDQFDDDEEEEESDMD